MALLQPRLNLKVAQRQVLTPGLMQMVSVLALNKLELKEMIDAEMVENPVLEEIDETVPMLDEVAAGRSDRSARSAWSSWTTGPRKHLQPPKIRSTRSISGRIFRNISIRATAPSRNMKTARSLVRELSFPADDTVRSPGVAAGSSDAGAGLGEAAEFIIGNLDEDGYLAVNEEELDRGSSPISESKVTDNRRLLSS